MLHVSHKVSWLIHLFLVLFFSFFSYSTFLSFFHTFTKLQCLFLNVSRGTIFLTINIFYLYLSVNHFLFQVHFPADISRETFPLYIYVY